MGEAVVSSNSVLGTLSTIGTNQPLGTLHYNGGSVLQHMHGPYVSARFQVSLELTDTVIVATACTLAMEAGLWMLELECAWEPGAVAVSRVGPELSGTLVLHDGSGFPHGKLELSGMSVETCRFSISDILGPTCSLKISVSSVQPVTTTDVERALMQQPPEGTG